MAGRPATRPGCPCLGCRHPCPHLPGAAVSALVRGGRPGTLPSPQPRAPHPPGYEELGLLWSPVKAPSGQSTVDSVASAAGRGLSLSRRPPAGSRDPAASDPRDEAGLGHLERLLVESLSSLMPSELRGVPAQGPASRLARTQVCPRDSERTPSPPCTGWGGDTGADSKASRLKWLSDCVIHYHQKESLLWERDLVTECPSPKCLCLRDSRGAGSCQACQQLELSCSPGRLLNANDCGPRLTAEKCHPRAVTRLRGFRCEGTNTPGLFLSSPRDKSPREPCIYCQGLGGHSGSHWTLARVLTQKPQRKSSSVCVADVVHV